MDKTFTRTALCTAFVLAGCGGGGAQVGGTVSGLASDTTVTLQDNGSDSLAVSANGSFAFATDVDGGGAYNVTILTQPVGQTCTVTGGVGSVDAAADPVSTVTVACVGTASVSGVVSGLAPGTAVTLSDGTAVLSVAANGPFAFAGILAPGAAYAVSVTTQPAGQTCAIVNETGTATAAGTTPIPVQVTCS
jgi:hypothetical protein